MREDVGDIDELAWSIRKHGVLQPILLTERKNGYLLVCGHRRVAASRRAGLTHVPAVVKEMTEEERVEIMIVENVHRKYLSPLEEAHAFTKMMEKGSSQVKVGSRIGKSQMYVSNRLALLKCEEEVQQKVHKGELSLHKAINVNRIPREKNRENEKHRDPTERWQTYYIDRLIGWLEAGRIADDRVINDKLRLLGRALKAYAGKGEKGKPVKGLPAGIKMCEGCGTVVDVKLRCECHGDLCEGCVAKVHEEDAA